MYLRLLKCSLIVYSNVNKLSIEVIKPREKFIKVTLKTLVPQNHFLKLPLSASIIESILLSTVNAPIYNYKDWRGVCFVNLPIICHFCEWTSIN